MWMNLKIIVLTKITRHKGHTLYDFVYMIYPESTNSQTQKADYWLSGAGDKGEWGLTT